MSSEHRLRQLLATPLPSKRKQRRLCYHPTKQEALDIFRILNECIYDNHLPIPRINFRSMLPKYWGMCVGYDNEALTCKLRFNRKFYCIQWFIMILAHEMAHQHQWSVQGPHRRTNKRKPLLSHGPTFYLYREKLKQFDIPLKETYSEEKWWKHQQLMKL